MKPIVLALLPFLLLASGSVAGVVYDIETVDSQAAGAPEITQVFLDGEKLRMDPPNTAGSAGESVLFLGDRKEMTILDHGRKVYTRIDEAARDRMAAQLGAAMEQYQAMLKTLPEDQRKMVAQMMPAMAETPAQLEVRKTGETADQNGYPCTRYDILDKGVKTHEFWVTGWENVEGGAEAAAVFRAMSEFFDAVRQSLAQAGGPAIQGPDAMMALLKEVDGYPVVTRMLGDGGLVLQETRLRSAEEKALEPALFQPPADYRAEAMEMP